MFRHRWLSLIFPKWRRDKLEIHFTKLILHWEQRKRFKVSSIRRPCDKSAVWSSFRGKLLDHYDTFEFYNHLWSIFPLLPFRTGTKFRFHFHPLEKNKLIHFPCDINSRFEEFDCSTRHLKEEKNSLYIYLQRMNSEYLS